MVFKVKVWGIFVSDSVSLPGSLPRMHVIKLWFEFLLLTCLTST